VYFERIRGSGQSRRRWREMGGEEGGSATYTEHGIAKKNELLQSTPASLFSAAL